MMEKEVEVSVVYTVNFSEQYRVDQQTFLKVIREVKNENQPNFHSGICAGALWPMISAYGMSLVSPDEYGKTVAVIMAGTIVGMSMELPLMTWIGNTFGFQIEFIVMDAFILLIAGLCHLFLPHASGEKRSKSNSPFTMLKNKGVLMVILLTVLAIVANYGIYTYITNLVNDIHYSGIGSAQILFGIGSILSVLVAGHFIDKHLRLFVSEC